MDETRLILITPTAADPDAAGPALERALAAADGMVAAVIVATGSDFAASLDAAKALVPVIQGHGAAALVLNDTRIAGRAAADGVHVETGTGDVAAARSSFGTDRIVGAANLKSRHAAMQAAEAVPDYVFFGRHDGDTHPEPHPRLLDLAAWWAELMTIPVVALAGNSAAGVAAAAGSGAEFVAVGRFVWDHPDGPVAAVAAASAIIAGRAEIADRPAEALA